MKCRACWSERAEVCRAPRWKVWLSACALAAPVKCRHCFYEFYVPLWSASANRARSIGSVASGAPTRFAPRKAA
jgi:hypothetical protein